MWFWHQNYTKSQKRKTFHCKTNRFGGWSILFSKILWRIMEVEALTQNNCVIYPFLKATKGYWRNANYISCDCTVCPYGHKPCCEGFLMTSNSDGTPYILSVERYRAITKDSIDPAECCGSLSRQAFENCYALYLQWHLSSFQDCPILIHSKAAGSCIF